MNIIPKFIRKEKAFTINELLIIIFCMAILASLILVSLSKSTMRSRDVRRKTDLEAIGTALTLYRIQNGHYPYANWARSSHNSWTNLENELKPFLSKLPRDPLSQIDQPSCESPPGAFSGNPCYAYRYNASSADPEKYDLIATLESPNDTDICSKKCWKYHTNGEMPFCNVCANGYSYDPKIYADH